MADTGPGRALTEAHRRRQLAVSATAVAQLVALFPAFDLADIDGSWPPLQAGLIAVILNSRRTSSATAAGYYQAFRAAEAVPGESGPVPAEPPNPTLMAGSLILAGPIGAKRNMTAGGGNASGRTLARLAGVVSRQVLDGGRRTLSLSARSDDRARGWRRVTGSDPCDFCRGIAARGVVGADVDFEAHSNCGCTQEPQFS